MKLVPSAKGDPATLIKRYLKVGGIGVDVGAATGELTTVMAKCVGPTGHVLAIEADATKRDALWSVHERFP